MKKFFKKFTTALLISAMLVTSLPAAAFASSSGGSEEAAKRAANSTMLQSYGSTANTSGKLNDGNKDNYMLAVETGNVCMLSLKSIVITYIPYGSTEKVTQILSPEYIETGSMASYFTGANAFATSANMWPGMGSKEITYKSVLGDATTSTPNYSYKLSDGTTLSPYVKEYYNWTKSLVSNLSGYSSVYEKATAAMHANDIEYYRFRLDYTLGTLCSLEFVIYPPTNGNSANILATNSEDWMLSSWSLYKINSDSLKIVNFAFVSDKVGLDFSGTCLYKSTAAANAKLADNGVGGDDARIIKFFNRAQLPSTLVEDGVTYTFNSKSEEYEIINSKGMAAEIGATGDIYRCDYYAGDKATFCFEAVNTERVAGTNSKIYNFAVNIADVYGAGIEAFNKSPDWSTGAAFTLKEMLTGKIEYTTIDGGIQTVTLPIISNGIMEFAIAENETNNPNYARVYNGQIETFAQQGEAICFSVQFPDIKKLNSIELTFSNPDDASDYFVVENVAVYNNWGYNDYPRRSMYTDRSNGASVDIYPDNAKLLYYADYDGEEAWLDIANNSVELTFNDLRNEANPQLPNVFDVETSYLVTLTTDSVDSSATQAEVFVQFEYEDTGGISRTTAEYSLEEQCKDMAGYIPGTATKYTAQHDKDTAEYIYDEKGDIKYDTSVVSLDASYYANMTEGKSVSFVLDIKKLAKFTGAYFRIDEDTEDAWQCGKIEIVKLNTGAAISRRYIDMAAARTISSNAGDDIKYSIKVPHGYTRRVTGATTLVSVNDAGVYLNHGGEKFVDFVNNNDVTGDDERKKNYDEYLESMEYSDAVSDLKLDVPAKYYEVHVHVASNSTASTGSDNCGSSNLYYFQLLFTNGTSAYVLANQQLEADSFRSGQNEQFTIAVNDDYGDVQAVNIIADDISSNANPLDKLCIDYLEIIKINTNTANKVFTIKNVGWIVADYTDVSSATERPTRSEYQLANTFNEITVGYALDLEFALSIDEYPTDASQFEGNMYMDFYYKDSNGSKKSMKGIAVVQKMYEYNDMSPKIDKNQNVISDTSKMFRAGTIDRFLVTITDCCLLERVVIKGVPYDATGFLKIADLNVSALRDKGSMKMVNSGKYTQVLDETGEPLLDENGNPVYNFEGNGEAEMTRVYKTGLEPITVGELKKKPQSAYEFVSSGSLSYQLYFSSESQIPDFDEDTQLSSLATREPQSTNDTLNLFIYLKDGVPDPIKGNYKLTTDISYQSVKDPDKELHVQTSGYTTMYDQGKLVLSRIGLKASNLSVISNVHLACSKISDNSLEVDHVILQHVRGGVIIDTYKVRFISTIFGRESGASMWDMLSAKESGYKQLVTLQLGPNTDTQELTPEENDIAVSITYKAKDLNTAKDVYTSQKVFATDNGTTSIHEGQMLSFEFNEANLDEIESITVNGVGTVTGVFNGANIKCYAPNSYSEPQLTGWFSVDAPDATEGESVDIGPTAFTATVASKSQDSLKALKRVDFTFKTTEVSELRDSSGSLPIRAKILYKQTNGGSGQVEIADIRDYVTKGSGFTPGSETTISLFLPGLKSLRSIELEPYDDDADTVASWNLDTIQYQTDGTDDNSLHTMPVKTTLREDNASLLNLSTIYLDLKVVNQGYVYETVNGVVDISADEGVTITFTPTIYESTAGYKVAVYKVVGGGLEQIKNYGSDIDSFNYTVTNPTTDILTYRFIVSSNENPAVTATVNVTIPPKFDNGATEEDITTTSGAIDTP